MRISLIQMESNGTKEENEKKTFSFLEQAVKERAYIICLSELFLSWGKDFNNGKVTVKDIEKYQDFANNNKVNIILRSVALKSNIENKITNTCFKTNIYVN